MENWKLAFFVIVCSAVGFLVGFSLVMFSAVLLTQ